MKNTDERRSLYKLLEDAYHGSGGFVDGNYLQKYHNEDGAKYQSRCAMAYYLNYTKPCVDAHIDPIFERNPMRDWKGPADKLWEKFVKDTDFTGTSLDDLMKRAAQSAKLCGVSFIVMDKEQTQVPKSDLVLADIEGRENIPYAILVTPIRVTELKIDKFGRLTYFAYTEADPNDDNKFNTRILKKDSWELREGSSANVLGSIIDQGQWDLGCVPVVPVFSRETAPNEYFPPSEFLSIAKTNKYIFNACSWLAEILFRQTFPLLVIPTSDPKDFSVGTNNAMAFSPESKHAPDYIAPPNGPADTLAKEIDSKRQECYRMAGVVNVTGVAASQSGVAKAWDFKHTNQMLANFSGILQAAEVRLAQLFSNWMDLDLELTVSYPTDFAYSDLEAELSNAVIAKDLSFGDEFNVEVFKRILTSYFPEMQPERFDELVKQYKAAQAEMKLNEQQTPPTEEQDPPTAEAG